MWHHRCYVHVFVISFATSLKNTFKKTQKIHLNFVAICCRWDCSLHGTVVTKGLTQKAQVFQKKRIMTLMPLSHRSRLDDVISAMQFGFVNLTSSGAFHKLGSLLLLLMFLLFFSLIFVLLPWLNRLHSETVSFFNMMHQCFLSFRASNRSRLSSDAGYIVCDIKIPEITLCKSYYCYDVFL